MTQETIRSQNILDHEARFADISRLSALCTDGPSLTKPVDVDLFAFEMAFPDFWLSLFGVATMDEIAAVLAQCNAEWHPVTQEPITYRDEFSNARQSLPFLGKAENGKVFAARIDFCDRDPCTYCPTWESAGRFDRLPTTGANRLVGWLSLDDILNLDGHNFVRIKLHQHGVRIGDSTYSEHQLKVFLTLHDQLEHGSEEDKKTLQSLIDSYQQGRQG